MKMASLFLTRTLSTNVDVIMLGNKEMAGQTLWIIYHIISQHPNYRFELNLDCLDGNQTKDKFLTPLSVKARNLYSWMSLVIKRNKTSRFVEGPEARMYS